MKQKTESRADVAAQTLEEVSDSPTGDSREQTPPSNKGGDGETVSYTGLRRKEQVSEKQGIAKYVAQRLIEPTRAIFLDAGSTVLEIAKEIFSRDILGLTIMTNNMEIFNEFVNKRPGRAPMTLIATGGEYDRDHDALFGMQAETALNSFYPHMVVIGTSGFSFRRGLFYHGYSNEGVIKEAILRKETSVRVIVCDYAKIGGTDSFRCGDKDWIYRNAERCILVTTTVPNHVQKEERKRYEKRFEEERNCLLDLNKELRNQGNPVVELVRVNENGDEIDRV